MSKRLILVLALAFVMGISLSAYAEVQNVKVSGDINLWAVARDNLDLAKTLTDSAVYQDSYKNFLSAVRVRVDADLTDNVMTTVRLINESVWDAEGSTNTNIDLDLAYVTLKEFLYSPLTLTIGRQELHFGNDMIVGDPDTNGVSANATANGVNLYEGDLSLRKAFDAIRATLNYDPLMIDVIYAKINEGTVTINDDTALYGINAKYAVDKATNLEAYGFAKVTDSNTAVAKTLTTQTTKADKVYTIGGKVNNTSVKNLNLGLEAAYQFGNYNPAFDLNANAAGKNVTRSAWGLEAIAMYNLKDALSSISKYSPSVGAAYIYLSGDNPAQKTDGKAWRGWDAMYENQTFGHLINDIMGFSNTQLIGVNAKMKPMEDVTLSADYIYARLNKAYKSGDVINLKGVSTANTYTMNHSNDLGQELDLTLTYDYTEDVQFSLLGGFFVPGNAFADDNDTPAHLLKNKASEIIGSMKVTF